MGRSMDGARNMIRSVSNATMMVLLALAGMVGGITLTALGNKVPPELWQVTFAALGAGAGISLPKGTTP